MDRRRRRGPLMGIALALALALPSSGAVTAQDPDPIVGAWQATLAADDQTTPVGIVFTADSSVIVTSPDGLDGAALGRWRRAGDAIHVTILAWADGEDEQLVMDATLQLIDGALSGTGTATLTPDGGEPEERPFDLSGTAITVDAPAIELPEASVITAAGDGPDAIAAAVAEYKALFGDDNGGEPGSRPDGFRTITWDGVPPEQSAPNPYDPAFFNGPAAPRARGAVFDAPAGSLMVSAARGEGVPVRFGNINIQYRDQFQAFSPEKLFSPVGTNIADLLFFVPGTDAPAVVRGFGAVYTDVDTDHTAFEYFDADGNSLGSFATPVADGGLSFLGVAFEEPIVARVRITYGTAVLGAADAPDNDVAVMDDFVFAEPQPIE